MRRSSAPHTRDRRSQSGLEAELAPRRTTSALVNFGGKMTRTPAIFFALLLAAAAPSVKAGDTVNIKCAPNEDRVWVYETLTDFNVAAKLKCGDPVQIVARVKGYVKIATANGTEGYVVDTSFPKSVLPPEPVEKPNDVESASLAFAAHRASRPPDASVDAPARTHAVAPAAVASAAPPAAVKPVAPSQPQPQAKVTLSSTGAVPPSETSAPVRAAPAPATTPAAPIMVAKNSNSGSSASTSIVVDNVEPVEPAKPVYKAPEPVKAPAPAPTPAPAAQPAPAAVAVTAPPRAIPVAAVTAPAPAVTTPAKAPAVVAVSNPAPVAPTSNASVSVPVPAPSVASNASSMTIEPSASLQPVADATPPRATAVIAAKPPTKRVVNPDEDEDSEVSALVNETANCAQYFSAYGLSANQYKWLAQNRKKAFPTVCPAPTPAQVDFVVIFTHDVDFYNATMPNAVHTDVNGFSDWTPLTTVDTAVISASDADKSHHEYVWVFHTNRGAFDPAKFSARRRPLYSKAETNMLGSRGGFRTVMDALTFIEQNGTNR
jgi:hypothetical protein